MLVVGVIPFINIWMGAAPSTHMPPLWGGTDISCITPSTHMPPLWGGKEKMLVERADCIKMKFHHLER